LIAQFKKLVALLAHLSQAPGWNVSGMRHPTDGLPLPLAITVTYHTADSRGGILRMSTEVCDKKQYATGEVYQLTICTIM